VHAACYRAAQGKALGLHPRRQDPMKQRGTKHTRTAKRASLRWAKTCMVCHTHAYWPARVTYNHASSEI